MLLDKNTYPDYILLRNKDITPSWNVKQIGLHHYEAITPNQFLIELSNYVNTTFDISKTPQYQSTMLWYHSLAWLRIIYNDYNDDVFVNNFIDTYYSFINSEFSDNIFSTLTSRDHLVAEQIRNLTYLLAQDDTRFNNKESAKKILLKLVNWAIIPGNILNNNHGMMLASALLHIPLFIEMPETEKNYLINLSSNRLVEVIESAFDGYGLCNENTPIYQNFYIKFLKNQIEELNFFEKYDNHYSIITTKLLEILSMAEHTLSLIALPTGELPPFGDGNFSTVKVTPIIENAEFFSADSGFFSIKNKKIKNKYFSAKCGYSSVVHKHCDDTSIFYWYDGQPIITDAGFLNYDWTDSRNVLVKSQRGHSGAFFKKFDKYYPAGLYKEDEVKNKIISSMSMNKQDNKTYLTCNITLDKDYSVKRVIQFAHLNNILITDHFTSLIDKRAEKCVRFLVPKIHKVEAFDKFILISNKNFEMELRYSRGNAVIKYGEMNSDLQPESGWVVDKPFHSLTECYIIEIQLDANIPSVSTNLILKENIQKQIDDTSEQNPNIAKTARLVGSPVIGEHSKIYRDCELTACIIGKRCTINQGVTIRPSVTIGDDVHIGAFATLMTDDHEIAGSNRRAGKFFVNPITVENGVWIGTGATILGGVTIGRGSIVAAGAVVTKDVVPNTIVAGVPAKVIRVLEDD